MELAKVYSIYIYTYIHKEVVTQSHTLNTVRPSHPQDLGLAATAGRSEELFVAVFTVDGSVFLHKASVCQRGLAVGAVELLLMPRLPHRYQKRPPDEEETLVTFDFLSVLPEPEQPNQNPPPPSLGAHIRRFSLHARPSCPSNCLLVWNQPHAH